MGLRSDLPERWPMGQPIHYITSGPARDVQLRSTHARMKTSLKVLFSAAVIGDALFAPSLFCN